MKSLSDSKSARLVALTTIAIFESVGPPWKNNDNSMNHLSAHCSKNIDKFLSGLILVERYQLLLGLVRS